MSRRYWYCYSKVWCPGGDERRFVARRYAVDTDIETLGGVATPLIERNDRRFQLKESVFDCS